MSKKGKHVRSEIDVSEVGKGKSRLRCIKFDEFVEHYYLPHARSRKRSWQVDERISRQYLSPVFGKKKLSQIEPSEVERWFQILLSGNLATSTCNRILAVLKSICSLGIRYGIYIKGEEPCRGVSSVRIYQKRERYLSVEESKLLLNALKKSTRIKAKVIRLLLLTGARKSEILKAKWEHIRLEEKLLIVPLSKSGKPRQIALSEEALEVIRSLKLKRKNQWLFPSSVTEGAISDVFQYWKGLRKSLGLEDVRIHDLRHTFASFLVNSGHSLYEVQKLLGHSDSRMTMRYSHLERGVLLKAVEEVSYGFSRSEKRKKETDNMPTMLYRGKSLVLNLLSRIGC